MDYDVEREKRKSEEIRNQFRLLFPLCMEEELPWAACQIREFLKERIELEVKQNTEYFVRSIAGVLCEVTHPKTHMIDMVRNVVEELKTARADKARAAEKAAQRQPGDEVE